MNDNSRENYDAIRWIQERAPKRLIVEIGHNDSTIWNIGFLGDVGVLPNIRQLVRLDELLSRLRECKIDVIIWSLMPKVGAVASLVPSTSPSGGYAQRYSPILFPYVKINGARVREADTAIMEMNDKIRKRVEAAFTKSPTKICFIETYDLFNGLDYKNLGDQKRRISVPNMPPDFWTVRVSNTYVKGDRLLDKPPPRVKTLEGGFQSIDGMHPSGVGYAKIAIEAMKSLEIDLGWSIPHEGSTISQAFRQDTLLNDYPDNLNLLLLYLQYGGMSAARKKVSKRNEATSRDIDMWFNLMSSVGSGWAERKRRRR